MRPQQTQEEQDRNPPVEHPMIRTHPETGEPAIYAGGFVVSIKNAPEELLGWRSEEHTSELQSQSNLVCRLLLEKKKRARSCKQEGSYTGKVSTAEHPG